MDPKLWLTTLLLAALGSCSTINPDDPRRAFFERWQGLCNAEFEGETVFPADPGPDFKDHPLTATIADCSENTVAIPFAVGENRSRTWLLRRLPGGDLELKHDHRHSDGTPDEITLYGGTTRNHGSVTQQSFPADAYTAQLIPDAATNEWFLTLSADGQQLTYYLERHGKPRFKAELQRVR